MNTDKELNNKSKRDSELRAKLYQNFNNYHKKLTEDKVSNSKAVTTPSPPKSLMTTNKFYQQLDTRYLTSLSSSATTTATTAASHTCNAFTLGSSQITNNRRNQTPDCDRKLKIGIGKLEKSGLLSKIQNFQITKNVPLHLEEEDDEREQQNEELNDSVFVDEITDEHECENELCCGNIEPKFVKNIKAEVAKISSQSFGSQRSSCGSVKLKSSKPSDSQKPIVSSQRSVTPLWRKLPKIPDYNIEKAKCVTNNALKHDDKQIASVNENRFSRPKSVEDVNKEKVKGRSKSSNGRLSSSAVDFSANESRKSEKQLELVKSKSQPSVNCKENKSNSSDNRQIEKKERTPSFRSITVNKSTYQILNCIGQGGSSKVYQVYDSARQMTLAIKAVDLSKTDEYTVAGYKNEIKLLSQLRKCKRVVRMYDHEYHNNGQLLLVVMEKGDSDLSAVLKSFIDCEEKNSLDSHLIRFYWQEMVKAVHEIHEEGIVHSDLKPVNFILVAGKLKLIDFGIANAIQANFTSVFKDSQIGTINYMAPETLKNRSEVKGKTMIKFNCKADIWSLGCILYNLVYGRTPFHHFSNLFQKASAILDASVQINYPSIEDGLLLDCMKKCLERDAKLRPTTEELLNHGYLTESRQSSKALANIENNSRSKQHSALISKINNLTPNRMKQLSQLLDGL